MKSKFITDPQQHTDGFADSDGAEFYTVSLPHSAGGPGDTSNDTPVAIPESPALTSEAVLSSSAQGSLGSVVVMTAGGITINLLFDAAAMAAPASFRAGIQQAASILTASISDHITVNIKIDYSGVGGGAAAGPDNGYYESYSSIRSDLVNNATAGDTTFNALPSGSSVQGQSSIAVWNAQLKLWGVLGANDTTTDDGSATFATDINPNLLVGVALHELTHAMGRVPYGTPYSSSPDVFDLFRYTSPGVRLINGASTAPAAYFSLDGGVTKLADFGQNSDPSDFLNSGVQGYNDPFNEYYTGSTLQTLTTVDKQMMDALGFHTSTIVPTVIESFGSTSLVLAGSYYYLDANSTGTGPQLKYGGSPVLLGQAAPWSPIGAEVIAGGYDVAWKAAGADQYSVWSTDSSGNFLSNLTGAVSGASSTLESYETILHQDLNGDGLIGVPTTTVIESFGSTSLVQSGNNYFLNAVGGGVGPELKYGGVPFVVGQWSTMTPIGAEATPTGYEVAWSVTGTGQYTVWNTDSSGNITNNTIGFVAGTSTTLESLETSFHQDLNGDGVIGIPGAVSTAIESFGSTSLVVVGNNYEMDTGGSGPTLKYGGSAVLVGQAAPWSPIGAEQTATGYDVAWKAAGADQYSIWGTDSNGNFQAFLTGAVSGSSVALQSYESILHQDLNGDGIIGVVIESLGSTSLVQVGSNYYMYAGGAGPELKMAGNPVVAGQAGSWSPIGAEVTATGYDVAWKDSVSGQFSIWTTDSGGNFQAFVTGAVPGNGSTLESYETIFHQDLNGDGVIGVPAATASGASQAAAFMVAGNDTFVFKPGMGAEIVAGAGSTTTIELDGFFSVRSDAELAALLHEAQAGQPQTLFQSTADGHDTIINLGHQDSITLTNVHLADLHANNFIIG